MTGRLQLVADDEPTVGPTVGLTVGLTDEPIDGRVARGMRTRRRVAEALVELLTEGNQQPTGKEIADRAGVSLRLVFHHFSDLDDLHHTVAALQIERYWSKLPKVRPDQPLVSRINAIVRHRATLYEAISPVRRVAVRRSGIASEINVGITMSNKMLTDNLSAAFAPELDPLPVKVRRDVLAAIDTATSWEAWERMRQHSQLSVPTAKRIMVRLISATLAS